MHAALALLLTSGTAFAAVQPWGQCGGNGWSGETQCVSGWSCKVTNEWYSQCIEGGGDGGGSNPAPTTLATVTATSTASTKPTGGVGGSGKNGAKCSIDAAFKAKGKKYIGVATDQGLLTRGSNAQLIIDNFGQVTPENSMKWDATEGSRGSFTLGTADYLVNWASTNNKLIRGHTTVWHSQLPNWVSSIRDKSTLQTVMVNHINKLIGGYKGKVYAWKTAPSARRSSTTYSARVSDQHRSLSSYTNSADFVGIAFRAARAADPAAKLYINDYNLDSASYSKTRGFASAVKRWVAAGIPIDGVGSQSHLANNWPISDFAGALKSVCADVSECAITELDIKGASTSDYQTAVKACLNEAKCVGVTVWGISDTDSWRASDKPLLFDGSSQAKAAYNGLCSILV